MKVLTYTNHTVKEQRRALHKWFDARKPGEPITPRLSTGQELLIPQKAPKEWPEEVRRQIDG